MSAIACVQMEISLKDYKTTKDFQNKIKGLVRQIRRNCHDDQLLIAFPEHIGTFCLLCDEHPAVLQSHSLEHAITNLIKRYIIPTIYRRTRYKITWARAISLYKADNVRNIYIKTLSEAAREAGAWISGGSVLLPEERNKEVYNVAYLFGPNGQVVARQKKVNLVQLEGPEGMDVSAGDLSELQVVSSPFGQLGLAVCLDAFRDDVRDRLVQLGAEVLLQPSANNRPWNQEQQQDWLTGSYQAVVEKKMFSLAVNPMLVGSLWDIKFEGQSSIVASSPSIVGEGQYRDLSPLAGLVKVAGDPNKEEILMLQY